MIDRAQHETAGLIGAGILALVAAMEARVALEGDQPDRPGVPKGWAHAFELHRRQEGKPPHRVLFCVRFPGDGGEPAVHEWDDTVTLAFRSAVHRLRTSFAGRAAEAEQTAASARTAAAAIEAALKGLGV